ncbi:hypothetical protein Purlil1_14390 [Purpureocillium lilacinum]|uniref:Uncharacterized protein n=1 Tax=Purpureocillium lilacinum TaxID=33203 RepID=A0ABR0BBE9_PURLI|nr:hypothetical protein Purlil1_14390 [Purpureocillium lilacinum]
MAPTGTSRHASMVMGRGAVGRAGDPDDHQRRREPPTAAGHCSTPRLAILATTAVHTSARVAASILTLKSFRNEMELCEGAVQDRAADADTAGSARCHETGERGRSPPGADTKREGEAAEDSDSEPPFLRSRRRLRRGRSSARGGAAV